MKNKVEIIIVAMQIRTGIKTKCKKKKKKCKTMATGDAFSYLSCDKCIRRKF